MVNLNPVDQQLLQIVTQAKPKTIQDVIQTMTDVDALLPNSDGLKWFNKLYLMVTKEVDGQSSEVVWSAPKWLARLDVIFATLYFVALADFLNDSPDTADSWKALFEARLGPHIDRVQFALAGMNAHINHDLALALVQTDAEMNLQPRLTGPEHDDFERVNIILNRVLPSALNFLAADILGELAQDTGKIGRLLAIWNVATARDAAWAFADYLRGIPAAARPLALQIQDKTTGLAGRGLLLPLQ
jgi:hypothetical protein